MLLYQNCSFIFYLRVFSYLCFSYYSGCTNLVLPPILIPQIFLLFWLHLSSVCSYFHPLDLSVTQAALIFCLLLFSSLRSFCYSGCTYHLLGPTLIPQILLLLLLHLSSAFSYCHPLDLSVVLAVFFPSSSCTCIFSHSYVFFCSGCNVSSQILYLLLLFLRLLRLHCNLIFCLF